MQRQNLAKQPAHSGRIAERREISVSTRIVPSTQSLSNRSLASVPPRQFCDLNVAERQHYPERTGIRAPLERYCPLISGAKGAPRSCPAGSIAVAGLRWCGGRREPNGGSQCPNLPRSDRLCLAQRLWLRQARRNTPLIPRLTSPTLARSNLVSSRCCSRLPAAAKAIEAQEIEPDALDLGKRLSWWWLGGL